MSDEVEQPAREIAQRGLVVRGVRGGCGLSARSRAHLRQADNTLFSGLTMNPQALHVDADWSSTPALRCSR